MTISVTDFVEQYKRLCHLSDRAYVKDRAKYLYNELSGYSLSNIMHGFDFLIDNPPKKLDIHSIKSALNQTGDKNIERDKYECPECDYGLIFVWQKKHNRRFRYAYRCPACRQDDRKIIPFYDKSLDSQVERINMGNQLTKNNHM